MNRADAIFKKLDRIPAAPNFVRYNFEDLIKTIKAYVAFAKGMPTISYVEGLKLVKDVVLGLTGPEQARIAARRMKASPSKSAIIAFIEAFCDFAENREFNATPAFAEFSATFEIGRNLSVPVRPTLVARESGRFKPVFVFGWKTVPLNDFQRRLLMTILEDAIFSLTDFQSSDAEIIFFPEVDGCRKPEVWNRADYNLLSEGELKDQMELFLSARDAAFPIIADWLKSTTSRPDAAETTVDPNQQVLDLRLPPNN